MNVYYIYVYIHIFMYTSMCAMDNDSDFIFIAHDIITRDAYSVSWAEIWEFSKSHRDIIDAVTI